MDITERKRAEEERERLRQLELNLHTSPRVNMMGNKKKKKWPPRWRTRLSNRLPPRLQAQMRFYDGWRMILQIWRGHAAAAARVDREGNRAADIINSLRPSTKQGHS